MRPVFPLDIADLIAVPTATLASEPEFDVQPEWPQIDYGEQDWRCGETILFDMKTRPAECLGVPLTLLLDPHFKRGTVLYPAEVPIDQGNSIEMIDANWPIEVFDNKAPHERCKWLDLDIVWPAYPNNVHSCKIPLNNREGRPPTRLELAARVAYEFRAFIITCQLIPAHEDHSSWALGFHPNVIQLADIYLVSLVNTQGSKWEANFKVRQRGRKLQSSP